ncbi:MAG TPA: hypothetical protein VMP03_01830 [Methylomirabilota bacterium]|nr:hypothetical protein [Methylomirabilota bacterium]
MYARPIHQAKRETGMVAMACGLDFGTSNTVLGVSVAVLSSRLGWV